MNEAIVNALSDIGLTRNEARTYLVLLKNNNGLSANELSSKAGMHRQVIYDSVERLLEKGFANFVIETGVKRFFALDPTNVLNYLHAREEHFKQFLPELSQYAAEESSAASINVFRG